mmetsp:Transcript_693/g.2694  ORF Transcript_693/g.2694 Transcript_693/m.2694 type:complete len:237 (-) Transcript_693:24-734(-)
MPDGKRAGGSDRGERQHRADLRDDAAGDGEVRTIVPAHSLLAGIRQDVRVHAVGVVRDCVRRGGVVSRDSHQAQGVGQRIPREELRRVLRRVQPDAGEGKLRHEAAVAQAPVGTVARSRQLVLDAQIHRRRREPVFDDEPAARRGEEHTVRGVPRVQSVRRQPAKTPAGRGHPEEEPGEADGVPGQLSKRPRGRAVRGREGHADQASRADGRRRRRPGSIAQLSSTRDSRAFRTRA